MDESGEQLFDNSSEERFCSALRGLVEIEQNGKSSSFGIVVEAFIDNGCPKPISLSIKDVCQMCPTSAHSFRSQLLIRCVRIGQNRRFKNDYLFQKSTNVKLGRGLQSSFELAAGMQPGSRVLGLSSGNDAMLLFGVVV